MLRDFVSFPLHLIVHPFDGFWDMKFEKRGKLKVALTLIFLTFLAIVVQKQFAGFLVNFNDPRQLNNLNELIYLVLPFFLWCIANWSVTTLLEGEGKFSEIVMASSYSLVPIVLIYFPMTLVSRFMAQEETAFYYLLNSIAGIWFVLLLFVGIMTVHQYSASKTIITMILSVIVMVIIVFLGALVFSMIQQIYEFIMNIYRELIFRT
ncbi:YIP1 family protein [Gorillibacterium timonense]|uniref:YIP1 family protein n=1 Tax=Gorillibacterium timonense TaxID=1689269 RepID=UPI00071C4EBF|nr:YIP1 family protein [Gorillibacterium timonense]